MSDRSTEADRQRQEDEYDTNLPSVHSYLGEMNSLKGYTLHDEGKELNNMLAIYAEVWVSPGHTFPLYIDYSVEVSILNQYLENSKTIVLISSKREDTAPNYGITLEVIELSENLTRSVAFKAIGRQRCRILHIKSHLTYRFAQVNIKILPDDRVSFPLFNAQLPSLNKKRKMITDHESVEENIKYRRYDSAQLYWPTIVYNQYEPHILSNRLRHLLKDYKFSELAPTDPVTLSYWFLQNFQLNNEERIEILKIDSVVQRLRMELFYLKMKRMLCCASCSTAIANQSDVFAMSKEGIQSNYCNPGGHVYETLTVSSVFRVNLVGNPSSQFSWFPGYSWTIAQCAECNQHLGWMFVSKKLKPKQFFGLAKSSIVAKIVCCEKLETLQARGELETDENIFVN